MHRSKTGPKVQSPFHQFKREVLPRIKALDAEIDAERLQRLYDDRNDEDERASVDILREYERRKDAVYSHWMNSPAEVMLRPEMGNGGCIYFHWVGKALHNVAQALVVSYVLNVFGDRQVASGKNAATGELIGKDDLSHARRNVRGFRYASTTYAKITADTGLSKDRIHDVLTTLEDDRNLVVREKRTKGRGLLVRPVTLIMMKLFDSQTTDPKLKKMIADEMADIEEEAELWERHNMHLKATNANHHRDVEYSKMRGAELHKYRRIFWGHWRKLWHETKTRIAATNRNPRHEFPVVKCTFIDQRITRACRGRPAAAVLLAQCCYWQSRAKIVRRGYEWFMHSDRQWVKELGIPLTVVNDNMDWLEAEGLIETRQWIWSRESKRLRDKPVTHVRVVGERLQELAYRDDSSRRTDKPVADVKDVKALKERIRKQLLVADAGPSDASVVK